MAVFGGYAFVLFTYSWAGALKIWGAVDALLRGEARLLELDKIPVVFLNRAYRYENPPVLSEFVLDHPTLACLGLFAVFYFEFVSLAAAFRPHLQRWWMAILVGFHFSTLFTMKVFFTPATVLLVILALRSPFARPLREWRPVLGEVPWFGPLLEAALCRIAALRGAPRTTTLFYPEDCAFARSLLPRLAGPAVAIQSQRSDAFEALCRRHPYLHRERDAIVGLHEHGDEQEVRLRSEALARAAAAGSGAKSWLFPLLAIPLPLWDRAYRTLARRARSATDLEGTGSEAVS